MVLLASLFLLAAAITAGVQAQAQVPPKQPFLQAQQRLSQTLLALPDHAFTQTIRRFRREPGGRQFEELDTIRLDVAVQSGVKRFSWPAENSYQSFSIFEMLGIEITEVGNLTLHVRSLMAAGEGNFQPAETKTLDGRPAIRFGYDVPAESSQFKMWVGDREAALGHAGAVWVDASSMELIRIEAHTHDAPADLKLASMVETMEFGPVSIGGVPFVLPISGELTIEDIHGGGRRNGVTYEAYRAYVAEPALTSGRGSQSAEGQIPEIELPPGLSMRVKLETEIDFDQSAIGDPIRAVLSSDAKHDKKVWAPKGAVVSGRIKLLQRIMEPQQHYVLGFSFSTLEFPGGRAELSSVSLADAGPFHGLLQSQRHWEVAREVRGETTRLKMKPGLLYWSMLRLKVPKGLPMTLRVASSDAGSQ